MEHFMNQIHPDMRDESSKSEIKDVMDVGRKADQLHAAYGTYKGDFVNKGRNNNFSMNQSQFKERQSQPLYTGQNIINNIRYPNSNVPQTHDYSYQNTNSQIQERAPYPQWQGHPNNARGWQRPPIKCHGCGKMGHGKFQCKANSQQG